MLWKLRSGLALSPPAAVAEFFGYCVVIPASARYRVFCRHSRDIGGVGTRTASTTAPRPPILQTGMITGRQAGRQRRSNMHWIVKASGRVLHRYMVQVSHPGPTISLNSSNTTSDHKPHSTTSKIPKELVQSLTWASNALRAGTACAQSSQCRSQGLSQGCLICCQKVRPGKNIVYHGLGRCCCQHEAYNVLVPATGD